MSDEEAIVKARGLIARAFSVVAEELNDAFANEEVPSKRARVIVIEDTGTIALQRSYDVAPDEADAEQWYDLVYVNA